MTDGFTGKKNRQIPRDKRVMAESGDPVSRFDCI